MNKWLSRLMALGLLLCLPGCGGRAPAADTAEKTELTVFAAASLTETLTEIGEAYTAENENVSLVFNFDSSGTLLTQIREGADCDIFISAAQKQMDELDCAAPGSPVDLLENRVVLAVGAEGHAGIDSFASLKTALENGGVLMAMGNADVPVGQYTGKILTHLGLSEEELARQGVITYGSNVKEITTQIAEGVVDCGIVYATDACSAGLIAVDTATEEMCGKVIYPAAVLTVSRDPAAAGAFLEYLRGDFARDVFQRVGFTPVV